MSKACKFGLLLLLATLSFLLLSDTPSGLTITQLPKFELEKELPEIPNLDLDRLRNANYITVPQSTIEDIAVDNNGNIYIAAGNGPSSIYKIQPSNTSLPLKIASTQGRVIGTSLNKQGNLLVLLDQKVGIRLLNVITGEIKTIAHEHEGQKFISLNSITFTNNPNIVYFTHSCALSMEVYHMEILYKSGTGKLIQLNLQTGKMRTVLNGLQFPNGLAYSEKQNCLYMNQIGFYRVLRVPLPTAEQNKPFSYTVLIDKLIGYPDNLKITDDNKIWVAIPSLRDKVNIFIDNQPFLRKALINTRMPEWMFLKFANLAYAGGIKIDPSTGKIVDYLFGKGDKINFVTSVVEKNNRVYMSSLKHNRIAVIDYI